MDTYEIEIKETLSRTITVEAENVEEAIDIANEEYKSGEVVLDAGDFVDYEINSVED